MVEQTSLEDAITFVSMREPEVIEAANARMPTQTVGFRNTPRGSERCAQVVTTGPMAQRVVSGWLGRVMTTNRQVIGIENITGKVVWIGLL